MAQGIDFYTDYDYAELDTFQLTTALTAINGLNVFTNGVKTITPAAGGMDLVVSSDSAIIGITGADTNGDNINDVFTVRPTKGSYGVAVITVTDRNSGLSGSVTVRINSRAEGDQITSFDYTTPMVVSGNNFTLALRADGTVWAWGMNNCGQLGIGYTSSEYISTPVQVIRRENYHNGKVLQNIIHIAAGANHALAVEAQSDYRGNVFTTVWAWGDNTYGQLGTGQLYLEDDFGNRVDKDGVNIKDSGGSPVAVSYATNARRVRQGDASTNWYSLNASRSEERRVGKEC